MGAAEEVESDFSLPGHPQPHNGLYEGYGAMTVLTEANLTPSRNNDNE
jgi:hypothetical protein